MADLGEPTTLLLVRHGQTEHTGGVLSGGDDDGPPLTPSGLAEADLVGRWLAGGAPSFSYVRRPDVVVTSPITRCRETAAPLAASLGIAPVVDPEWRELMFGDWHGLGLGEVAERWPDELKAWRADTSLAPPGGESLDDLRIRAGAARDRVVAGHPGRCVVVVSHLAPIRAVLAAALDAGPAALWRLRVDPASVSVLRVWADGGAEVAGVNLAASALG